MGKKPIHKIIGFIMLMMLSLALAIPYATAACYNLNVFDCDIFNETDSNTTGATDINAKNWVAYTTLPHIVDKTANLLNQSGAEGMRVTQSTTFTNATFWSLINTSENTTWFIRGGNDVADSTCWWRIMLNNTIGYSNLVDDISVADNQILSTGIQNPFNKKLWFVSFFDSERDKCDLYIYNMSGTNLWNRTNISLYTGITTVNFYTWGYYTTPVNAYGSNANLVEYYQCPGLNLTCHSAFTGAGETPSVSSDTGLVDIVAWNSSHAIKSNFNNINEDFWLALNYTNSSGSTITTGQCIINITSAINLFTYNDTATSICTSCSPPSIFYSVAMNNTNVEYDIPSFRACHTNLLSGNLKANISCGTLSYAKTIFAAEIPLCSAVSTLVYPFNQGTRFFINSTICKSVKNINFSVTNDAATSNKAINISRLTYAREFNNRSYNVNYNSTSKFYELNETFRGYISGYKNITGECNRTGQFNATKTEEFLIGNIPAEIFISGIMVDGTVYNLTNNSNFEYKNGTYFFLISVNDVYYSNASVTIGNNSKIIQTFADYMNINISADFFRYYSAQPFYINISVYDTYGNVTKYMYNFNSTDTIFPIQTGFANFSAPNATLYQWNITLEDESIFGFNLTCDNGFNKTVTGITGTDTYIWSNETMLITQNITCQLIYCDGHTARELKNKWNVEFSGGKIKTKNTRQQIEFWGENLIMDEYKVKSDRISFKLSFNDSLNEKKIFYKAPGSSYYLASDKYKGWIVNYPETKTWFDVNGFKGTVDAYSEDGITWELTLKDSKDKIKGFQMESIGELNCRTESIFIESIVPRDTHTSLQALQCPKDTESVLVFGIIITLLFVMLGMNMVYFRIPMFNIIIGIAFIVISLVLFGCHWVIGTTMLAFGIIVILSAVL